MVYKPTHDWQEVVTQTLIDAGIAGIKQRDLHVLVSVFVAVEDMITYLEYLRGEGKVQKFPYTNDGTSHGGASGTIWRATYKIKEQ